MIKRIGIALFAVILLGACRQDKMSNPIPKDVIPVDSMIYVMTDLMVIESALRTDFPQVINDSEIVKNSGDTILANYGLSFERYDRSLSYYLFDQDTMKYIYDRITDRIGQRLNELEIN